MNIDDIFATPKTTVFDNYVPMITNKHTTTVYLTDVIEAPSLYNELCYKLDNASPAEEFFIYINTPGGILDAAIMTVNSIKNTAANTTARLSGTVASAGTIIALACKNVEVADHTAFMIHNYSASGISGKAHELKAYQAFTERSLEASFREFYKGFLTQKEMKSVIDGQDMWFTTDEVRERVIKLNEFRITPLAEELVTTAKRGRKPKTLSSPQE